MQTSILGKLADHEWVDFTGETGPSWSASSCPVRSEAGSRIGPTIFQAGVFRGPEGQYLGRFTSRALLLSSHRPKDSPRATPSPRPSVATPAALRCRFRTSNHLSRFVVVAPFDTSLLAIKLAWPDQAEPAVCDQSLPLGAHWNLCFHLQS